MSDYSLRGTCKEATTILCQENPQLKQVRGWYHCAFWGKQAHWWCEDKQGNIVDPTKKQFPDQNGEYEEFCGVCECSNCGKKITEEEGQIYSNYIFCSGECMCRFVL